jgi:transcriptional regulator with XRE-family HTH domain
MPEIGETLRDARMRAHIDVSEIEAETKIRAKYLRALENEEWSLLPGPTFVKSFLRTYAKALGVDGKALVEEYRLNHEPTSDGSPEPIVSSPQQRQGAARAPRGPSRGYLIGLGVVLLVIVLLVVGLLTGGGGSSKNSASTTPARTSGATSTTHAAHAAKGASARSGVVTLSLRATSAVFVCLIGDGGHKLIAGADLHAGSITPTFRAKRFQITLGNSSVSMIVDGTPRTVPASSHAIGYTITKATGRKQLPLGQLPSCT